MVVTEQLTYALLRGIRVRLGHWFLTVLGYPE